MSMNSKPFVSTNMQFLTCRFYSSWWCTPAI